MSPSTRKAKDHYMQMSNVNLSMALGAIDLMLERNQIEEAKEQIKICWNNADTLEKDYLSKLPNPRDDYE